MNLESIDGVLYAEDGAGNLVGWFAIPRVKQGQAYDP